MAQLSGRHLSLLEVIEANSLSSLAGREPERGELPEWKRLSGLYKVLRFAQIPAIPKNCLSASSLRHYLG
jgi:hypothetical protein